MIYYRADPRIGPSEVGDLLSQPYRWGDDAHVPEDELNKIKFPERSGPPP